MLVRSVYTCDLQTTVFQACILYSGEAQSARPFVLFSLRVVGVCVSLLVRVCFSSLLCVCRNVRVCSPSSLSLLPSCSCVCECVSPSNEPGGEVMSKMRTAREKHRPVQIERFVRPTLETPKGARATGARALSPRFTIIG